MKRLTCLLLTAVLLLGLAGCSGGSSPEKDAGTPSPLPENTMEPELPVDTAGLGVPDWEPEKDEAYLRVKTYREGDTFVQTAEGMVPVTLGLVGSAYIPLDCSVVVQSRDVFYIMDTEGAKTNTAFFAAKRTEGETEGLLEKTAADLEADVKADYTDEIVIQNVRRIQIDGNDGILYEILNKNTHILSRRFVTNYEGYTYLFQFMAEESKAIADDRGNKIVASFKFGRVGVGEIDDLAGWNPATDPNFKLQKTLFGISLYIPKDYVVMGMVGDYGIMCYTIDGIDDNRLLLQVAYGPEETGLLSYTAQDMENRLKNYYPDAKVAKEEFVTIGGRDGIKFVTTGLTDEDGTPTIQTRYGVTYDSKTFWLLYVTRDMSGNDSLGDLLLRGVIFGEVPDTQTSGSVGGIDEVTDVVDEAYTIVTSVYTMKVTYTGQWRNSMPHGDGIATTVEDVPGRFGVGDTLSGNWVNGLIEGEGEYTSGTFQLRGTFINGLKEGTVQMYENGKLVGEMQFKNGSPVS